MLLIILFLRVKRYHHEIKVREIIKTSVFDMSSYHTLYCIFNFYHELYFSTSTVTKATFGNINDYFCLQDIY